MGYKIKNSTFSNWSSVKLGDIIELEYGKGLPKRERDKDGSFPVFGSNGIVGWHTDYLIDGPCLIVGRKGAAGKVHLSKAKCWPIDTTYYVKQTEGVNLEFLFYLLRSLYLESLDKSTAIPGLNRNDAYDLDISIPPLPLQHRIVEKIEELFSDLDNGVENLKKAREQLKTYRQAILKAAFEGRLTKEWREQQEDLPTPEELLEQIKAKRKAYRQRELAEWEKKVEQWEKEGKPRNKPRKPRKSTTLPPLEKKILDELSNLPENWKWSQFYNVTFNIGDVNHKMPKVAEQGLPYLSTGDIKADGTLDFSNTKIISEEDFYELSQKTKPERGDIIFPRYGTIGRNVLVDTDREFLISYSCAVIKNIMNVMNEKFIYYYTLSPIIKKEIEKYIVDTTQANIGLTSIGSFVIPICSKKEQDQIIQEIESSLSVVDQLEQTIKQNLQKSEALRQSILKKAFRGKLVKE